MLGSLADPEPVMVRKPDMFPVSMKLTSEGETNVLYTHTHCKVQGAMRAFNGGLCLIF